MRCGFSRIVGHKSGFAFVVAALLRVAFTAITAVTVARAAFTAFRRAAFVAWSLTVFGIHFLHGAFSDLGDVAFWALSVRLATLATFTAAFASLTTAFTAFTAAFATAF